MPKELAYNDWTCNICGKHYKEWSFAYSCEKKHDVIYVPIYRSDLFKLVQFLYTGDLSLITETLMETLRKYSTQIKGQDSEDK